jgi:alpha-tubulin suppressor-like RCC1 family protein
VQFSNEPTLIDGLSKVIKIECSKNSSFALQSSTTTTSLYSWGSNKHGILGHSNSTLKNLYQPERISFFAESDKIVQFHAGGNHAAAIIQRKQSEEAYESLLFVWGSNKYSQLGLGDNQSRDQPTKVCILNNDEEGFLTYRNKQVVNGACGD